MPRHLGEAKCRLGLHGKRSIFFTGTPGTL